MKMLWIAFFAFIYVINAELNKQIDDECTVDSDCMNTWAYCNPSKKKCDCIDGFFANAEKKCKPKKPYCPSFIMENGTVLSQNPTSAPPPCESRVTTDRAGNKVPTTNCTKTSDFCFIHSNAFTEDGLPFGHCCPKPTDPKVKLSIACPTTDTTCLTCPYLNNPGNCPESHKCYNDIPNNQVQSCCPISCRGKTIKIAGTGLCKKKVDINESCEYNAQCPIDAECKRARFGRRRRPQHGSVKRCQKKRQDK